MRYAIVFSLLTVLAVSVQAQAPTDTSVSEMLHYLQVDKLLTQAVSQMNDGLVKAMDQKIQTTMQGRQLTSEQTAAVDRFRTRFTKIVQDDLSLAKIRAIYLQCYKETFTQQDVDGVVAFYKSPAGQAVASKYPEVMQKAQTLMQAKLASLSTNVEKDLDQMISDLEKAEPKASPAAASSSSGRKSGHGTPTVDTGKPAAKKP